MNTGSTCNYNISLATRNQTVVETFNMMNYNSIKVILLISFSDYIKTDGKLYSNPQVQQDSVL